MGLGKATNITIIHVNITKIFLKCLFIFKRDRDRASTGEEQRDRETESEVGSRLQAVSTEPDVGLELTSHEIGT